MTKMIEQATLDDVGLINQIEPPVRGVHAGGGIHVEIPDDWEARIRAGEDVAGCSYARIRDDGSLLVDDRAQAELARPGREALAARLVDVTAAEPALADEAVRGKP